MRKVCEALKILGLSVSCSKKYGDIDERQAKESEKNMEIMQVHQMVTDCWRLYKTYYSLDQTDEVLEQIHGDAVALVKKYESDTFANAVIAAVVNELGDIWKRKHSI